MQKLKNLYNQQLIDNLSSEIINYYPQFKEKDFKNSIFNQVWDSLELKERMRHIAINLHKFLPKYQIAIQILIKASKKFSGLEHMFFPYFVEIYGLDDFDTSIKALEIFTENSSSEFAIRKFLIADSNKTLAQMHIWAKSKNHHHRRLATEGLRPLLPWANVLQKFKQDPTEVIKILEILKNDTSAYVRKSVANNLNDISKNHPNLILELAKNWQNQSKNINQIIKHGLRTLLKQSNITALNLFGFESPTHIEMVNFKYDKEVKTGQKFNFSFEITSNKSLGKTRIEYEINFMKKNGKLAPKVFYISESETNKKNKKINKYFNFKKISTRKYYAGKHQISIIINGVKKYTANFKLT